MNEILKLGLTLMIASMIAGAALAFTNYFTSQKIEEQRMLASKDSLSKVMTADSFEERDGYYEAYDKNKKVIGKVLKVQIKGYASIISALVGVDSNNKITGIEIISQAETPGLGANIIKEDFLNQFIGKTKEDLKIKKDGGKIDAITGATISSRSVTNGIRSALEGN